ncbi:hypothetical protein Bca4012_026278 [Brassica carinata]|uniref:Xylanase inhibitor C-terminal domain-containing protein n=1 Tax=Brassica carinata TaxID=52824 RepID=A0A8X7VIE8_BRACI|nr:hypothetical protein Bca52824_023364 [Brassica carinata]
MRQEEDRRHVFGQCRFWIWGVLGFWAYGPLLLGLVIRIVGFSAFGRIVGLALFYLRKKKKIEKKKQYTRWLSNVHKAIKIIYTVKKKIILYKFTSQTEVTTNNKQQKIIMNAPVFILLRSPIFFDLANASHSFDVPNVYAFLHPILKDKATNLYFIDSSIGASSHYREQNFVVDLNGATPLLLKCANAAKSTSCHPIKCSSRRFKYANPNFSCPKTKKKSICRSSGNAKLFRDTDYLQYTNNGVYAMDMGKSSKLTLTCTDDATELKTIPLGFNGSSLVSMYKFPPKLSLCLPSSQGLGPYSGDLWIGGGPFYYHPYIGDVSTIFASTPLIGNNKSGEYLIDVKSIQIDGKTVPILHGAAKICTMAPYTVLHTYIYKALVTAFVGTTKMTKAPAVKPFGACFRSNGGHGDPRVNSLVKVKKNVVCLGFVDRGVKTKNPIVIGGYQLEDNLVEFDLNSKFSFSSSLLIHNTSCTRERLF